MVTMHWIDKKTTKSSSILLAVINLAPGTGVGACVGNAIYDFLESLGVACLSKLIAVVSDNGSDAISAVTTLFHQVNRKLGTSLLTPAYHNQCADHSIQLAVLKVLTSIKVATGKL